jgi:hypothetical protein
MFKKILSYSILLVFFLSCSKKHPTPFSVENSILPMYKLAEKRLKNKDLYNGLNAFHFVKKYDTISILGQKASKKVDSLLPIFKSSNYKKIKGLWKLKELHYDPEPGLFTDYIEFKDNEINFYNYDSLGSKKLVRKEEKTYTEIDSMMLSIEANHFTFKNTEEWSFFADKKDGILKLYPKIERHSNGGSSMLIDERHSIRDKRKKRKALKEEFYTYYILVK